MKKFTPNDLKNKYPGKYDDWKFSKNGKGEWIGFLEKEYGVIVSKKDKSGKLTPHFQSRTTQALSPSVGVIPFMASEAINKKNKSKNKIPIWKTTLLIVALYILIKIIISIIS